MTAARIIETNEGIQSEVTAEIFDESSLYASYTQVEMEKLLNSSRLKGGVVRKDFMGLRITGEKR